MNPFRQNQAYISSARIFTALILLSLLASAATLARANTNSHPISPLPSPQPSTSSRLPVILRVRAGTDLRPYLEGTLVRPYVDSLGLQAVTGLARAEALPRIARLPGVVSLRLADSALAEPLGEALPPFPSEADIAARLEAMRALPRNARSLPARLELAPSGWWDVSAGHQSAAAWALGFTGDGVRVLINDSGIDFCHPDLIGRWAVVTDTASPYYAWPMMFDDASMYLYAQDVHLDTNNVPAGLTNYTDTRFTCTAGSPCLYQPIGAVAPFTYTLPAVSLSGVYHLGSHPDTRLGQLQGARAAVLVTDEAAPGVYDHVYVDLDGDHDFSDETPATRDMPVACLDNWHAANAAPGADGYNDLSGGLIYFIADGLNPLPASDWMWGGLTPTNGDLVAFTIVDPANTLYGGAHGQWVASNVAAQGVINGGAPAFKPPYLAHGDGMVLGGGRDVRLVANGNFYRSPLVDAGFLLAALGYDGVAGTADDIHIISNSWGSSNTRNPAWDVESRLIEAASRQNPLLSVIFAAGNGGPGYGTLTAPLPLSALEVGASTQFDATGLMDSITSTGQIHWGEAATLSARGPDAAGRVGVEVAANGSLGSGDQALNAVADGWSAWLRWRGTSRSAPVAAANLALVYDAYRQAHGVWPDAATAQAILASAADQSANDPLAQGSGVVNALRAVQAAAGLQGFSLSPTAWRAGDYRGQVYPGFAAIVVPGGGASTVFTLTNATAAPISGALSASRLERFGATSLSFTSQNLSAESPVSVYTRPDYLIDLSGLIPTATELLEARLVYPFAQFDPDGNAIQNQRWELIALDWSDIDDDGLLWDDLNGNGAVNDGDIDPYEYMRFNHDYNTANALSLTVERPLEQMHSGVFLALNHQQRSAAIPTTSFTIQLNFYRQANWDWVAFHQPSVEIPAGGTARFTATLDVPADAALGYYSGEIHVQAAGQDSAAPVSVNVAAASPTFQLGGTPPQDALYDNGYIFGNFDWSWRAEAGDHRLFFADLPDNPPPGAGWIVHNVWNSTPPTDMDTRLFGPAADAFASADPLTYGPYSLTPIGGSVDTYLGSGKYTFQTATGAAEEWLSAPLGEGLHLVSHHNVLFSGDRLGVPYTTTLGSASIAPYPVVIQACAPSGTAAITFTASLPLDGLAGDAFGLALTQVYTAQQVVQDDPLLPATASYTLPLTIAHGGLIQAATGNSPGNDLDLYLLYDQNEDGIYDWSDEVVASSLNPGAEESLHWDFPTDGAYLLAIHGVDVPAPPASFDLETLVIQGNDLALGALPAGAFPAGGAALQFDWNKTPAAGELWRGRLSLGPLHLPHASTAEVYLLPCDASGLLTQAGFHSNSPVTWGQPVQLTNTSSGAPPLAYTWDFGDGSPHSTLENPEHAYAAPGTYTVTLTVSNAFSRDSLAQTVRVDDTPPALSGLSVTQPLYEGSAAQLSGLIVDPGYPGGYQFSVDWGDASQETFTYPPDASAIGLVHPYSDDWPANTAVDTYTITLTITDSLGLTSTALLPLTVSNVSPTIEAGAGLILAARLPFTRQGSFTDPGADLWAASVDYGGGPQPLA
ncbi:MAG: PKD domain-containing protein, partial [Chloroflexi bacterium]|nr:PKD domain-containing protein [Chloroflexota bacterium]